MFQLKKISTIYLAISTQQVDPHLCGMVHGMVQKNVSQYAKTRQCVLCGKEPEIKTAIS